MTSLFTGRRMLNKVPEITLYFWIIKVLCTTVGETAADFLNVNLNFGLTGTSVVTGVLLLIALIVQFKTNRYIPIIYWLAVALISVFGTLVTDNLTDAMGVPLEFSTVLFTILLALAFLAWYGSEKTLSIHSIFTTKREAFYWLTVLFTFALGTGAGDLFAESLGLGYLVTGMIVAVLIVVIAIAWRLGMHSVLSFWLIYILTRPLGASIGDLLSQPTAHGGLGLGATMTSVIFCGGIVLIVAYLSLTKRDVIVGMKADIAESHERGGLWQTVIAVGLLLLAAGSCYAFRQKQLQAATEQTTGTSSSGSSQPSGIGDLSSFKTITSDTLALVNAGNQSGAVTRIADLEYSWDQAEAVLKRRDPSRWTEVDTAIDGALRAVRAVHPDSASEKSALQYLLDVIG